MADKGRGRSRSRARSAAQPEVTRPGQRAPVQEAQPPLPSVGRVARGTLLSTGGGDSVLRPGASVQQLAAGLAALSTHPGSGAQGDFGTRGGGRGAWRSRDPVTRPLHITDKRGESGKVVQVAANYFVLESSPKWAVRIYHADFFPEVDSVRLKRGLMHEHHSMFGKYIFDGGSLFSTNRLPQNEMDLVSKIKFSDEPVKIHLKFVKEVSFKDPIVMQIMNLQMRRNMRTLDFKLLDRHYFDPAAEEKVDNQRFRIWPGFSTAIHEYDMSTMLCADLKFKIMRDDSVLDQLQIIFRMDQHAFRINAAKELVGSIVLTRYNNMTYRIDDILWDCDPSTEFDYKGQRISLIDFYRQKYNLEVRDLHQPLLVSNPKKRDEKRGKTNSSWLLPEFSIMTGITDAIRSDFKIMRDLQNHTRVGPDDRGTALQAFMSRMMNNPTVKQEMTDWGFVFRRELVQFQARVHAPEKILQDGGVSFYYKEHTADWTVESRGKKLLRSVNISKHILIATIKDMPLCEKFIDVLYDVCLPMGIQIEYPTYVALRSDRAAEFSRALGENLQLGHQMQLAICVVPNNRKDRYDEIKKSCCILHPVPSQVIVARTISRQDKLMSVATKIGIQLNCKLGGAAWAVEVPLKNLMVVGYDSYHDSSQRGRSVGAICCSFNQSLTQYYSRVTFQTSRQEMIDGLKINLTAAIRHYHNVNKTMPDRIIFYRDGVGDGQLADVKEFELEQIMNSFKEIGPNFSPRLAFVVVNKRINTRIFSKAGRSLSNPLPGTIVDSVITRPEFYDFFIVSQSVRQGTVSPTQYNVIHDDSQLKPDHMQRLTYKLTHLYYNWPGTIRVPAPCLYAHKLAFLAGQSLHTLPAEKLADTLFYL